MGCNQGKEKDVNEISPQNQDLSNKQNKNETILVIGASGSQGGEVMKCLLRQNKFKVRGLTRTYNKLAAYEDQIEIVEGDLDDMESLRVAMLGVYGVFAMTNYWEHMSTVKEMQQAGNIAEAARMAQVRHVVWSTFESAEEVLQQVAQKQKDTEYFVAHTEGKYIANEYFSQLPTTYLNTSFFYQNFINLDSAPKLIEGQYQMWHTMQDVALPMVDCSDIGRAVASIFNDPQTIGQTFCLASTHLTYQQISQVFANVLGQQVVVNSISDDDMAAMQFPGATDLAYMFQYKRTSVQFRTSRDIAVMEKLIGQPASDFTEFIERNKDLIYKLQ